jgi:hypothetical protein
VLVICTTEFSVLLKISGNVNSSEVDIGEGNELVLMLLPKVSFDRWAIDSGEANPRNTVVAKMMIAKIQR